MTPSMHKVSDLKVGDAFADYIEYGNSMVLDSQHRIIEIKRKSSPVYNSHILQHFTLEDTSSVSYTTTIEECYVITSRIFNRDGILYGAQTDVYSKDEYFLRRKLVKLNEERKKITITVGDLV